MRERWRIYRVDYSNWKYVWLAARVGAQAGFATVLAARVGAQAGFATVLAARVGAQADS